MPFGRPLDFEGPIRLVFLEIFCATAEAILFLLFDNYTAETGEGRTTKNIDKTKVQSTRRFSMFKRETRRPKGAPNLVILRLVGAPRSILCAILAPIGFRRVDPLGVSRCIWRNRKN